MVIIYPAFFSPTPGAITLEWEYLVPRTRPKQKIMKAWDYELIDKDSYSVRHDLSFSLLSFRLRRKTTLFHRL